MPRRSILLIEDIDCAFASREDEEDILFAPASPYVDANGVVPRRSAVTLSGLLNIIDGVDSEEGKFFIATVPNFPFIINNYSSFLPMTD